MRKFWRGAGVAAGILMLVLLLTWMAIRLYLSTTHAKQQVAQRLSDGLGMPVEVDDLSLGTSTVSFKLRAFEPPSVDPALATLLSVDRVEADLSPLDLAMGKRPRKLTLHGAHLTLRLDDRDNLLTRLPETQTETGGALPELRLEGASITIRREGSADFELRGIEGTLRQEESRMVAEGKVQDPFWKDWSVRGGWQADTGAYSVELENAGLHFTQAHLKALPFVPRSVWNHLEMDGTTTVRMTVNRPVGGELGYRVDLKPTATRVVIPSADLTGTVLSGEVVVEGARVRLMNMHGKVADGQITGDADLDFGPEPWRLAFKLQGKRLDLGSLPESWGLPDDLGGRLRGKAELVVLVPKKGEPELRGQGEGVIEEAVLAGFEAEPIDIRLRSSGERYRFETEPRGAKPTGTKTGRGPERRLNPFAELALLSLVALQPPARDDKPREAPYVDARLRLRDVDLDELFTRLKIDLPLSLSGKASADVTVSIPVTAARETRAYRLKGKITSPRLTVEGLEVDDFEANLSYNDGVLKLDQLTASPRGPDGARGSIEGTARLEVEPRGDLKANLKLVDVPLGPLLAAVPDLGFKGAGLVSGEAAFFAPLEKISDATTWKGNATLRSKKLELAGRRLDEPRIEVKLDRGEARLTTAKATVEGLPLDVAGTLALTEPFRFDARVRTAAAEAVALRRLAPELALPFDVSGSLETDSRLKGSLSPLKFTASGSARATALKVGDVSVQRLAVRWEADETRLRLSDLDAALYEGTLTGKADVPLQPQAKGDFDVAVKGVDAEALARAIPDFPVALAGKVTGRVSGTLPPARKDGTRPATADVELSAPTLRLQGIPTERVTARIGYTPQALEYSVKGDALGGDFELEGTYPLVRAEQGQVKVDDGGGSFRLQGAQLARLASALRVRALAALSGQLDVNLNYTFTPEGPSGRGRVVLRRLRWGEATLSPQLSADLALDPLSLDLNNLAGRLAAGALHGRFRYNLAQPQRSFFVLSLEQADPTLLLQPLPDLVGVAEGPITIQARGNVGRVWRGQAVVALPRGRIAGLPAAEVRLPFDWALAPGGGGRVELREPAGQLARGRVTGRASYEWTAGGGARTEGDLRFTNLDVGAIQNDGGSVTGRATGRLTFGGSDMRSLDDLNGQLVATLGQVSPSEVPTLSRIRPHLRTGQGLTNFQSGDLRARLSRGALRVERLTLASADLQLFAEGTVTYQGRLDLEVLANTGRVGPDQRLVRLLATQIPAVGGVPLVVLREASDFLSYRLVRFDVTGTYANPVVRVNTRALVTEEAVRYFLVRSPIPGIQELRALRP